jgi:hypothetical protein
MTEAPGAYDVEFSRAVDSAVNGSPERLTEILRSNAVLGSGERERLAELTERCAELANGDRGGKVGRRDITAGHPLVLRATERLNELLLTPMQISQAKATVAAELNLSVRTLEKYILLIKEREEAKGKAEANAVK